MSPIDRSGRGGTDYSSASVNIAPEDKDALGAAFVGGVRRHPLLGPAFDLAAGTFGYDRKRLEALEQTIGSESTGEWVSGLVGEIGPDFVLGGAAMGLGRAAAMRGLQAVAAGQRTGQLGLVAARSVRDANIAAGHMGAIRPMAVPWAEVLAKTAGGQTAQAAYFGGSEYLRSGSTADALKAAAISAAIGSVIEGVPVGLGSLTQKARAARTPQEPLLARARATTGPIHQEIREAQTRLGKLNERLQTALEVERTSANLVQQDELAKALTTLPTAIAKTQARVEAARGVLAQPIEHLTFSDKPFTPKGFSRVIFEAARKVATTPEALFQRMGVNAGRLFERYRAAEMAVNLEGTVLGEQALQWRTSALRAIGQNPHTRDPAKRELLWRLHHEWERLHPEGRLQTADESRASVVQFLTRPPKEWAKRVGQVNTQQANQYVDVVEQASSQLATIGQRLEKVGAEVMFKDPDLLANQVSRYWTHLGDPSLDDSTHFARLTSLLGDEGEALKAMQNADDVGWLPSQRIARDEGPTRQVVRRIGKFSSFDYSRTVPGTGWEKLRKGMPLNDDPWDTLSRYLKAGVRRDHFSRAVGPNGELVDVVQQAVEQEVKAAAAARKLQPGQATLSPRGEGVEAGNLFKNVMDELLDHKYHSEGVIQLTRMITSLNVASKLALSLPAQLSQFQNTVFLAGLGNTLKGFAQLANRESRQRAAMALAIPHAAARATAGMFESSTTALRSERFAEGVLKYTGFSPTEKLLRVHSYFTGNALLRHDLLKAANGRLKGSALDSSQRALSEMGVDLALEVKELRRLGPTAYFDPAQNPRIAAISDRAGYRLAQRSQFVPSKSRRPLAWDHPLGRVAFQFKTFALGQSRLIKDSVLAEAALGNIRPLAYWVSMTPLSGAFITKSKDLFREKPLEFSDHPAARVAQLFMSAGGFGLAGDMFHSAARGDLTEFIGGPTTTQVSDWAAAVANADMDALTKSGTQLPLVRLFSHVLMAGGGALQMTDQMVDEFLRTSTEDGDRVTIDLGDAAYQRARQKTGGGM